MARCWIVPEADDSHSEETFALFCPLGTDGTSASNGNPHNTNVPKKFCGSVQPNHFQPFATICKTLNSKYRVHWRLKFTFPQVSSKIWLKVHKICIFG